MAEPLAEAIEAEVASLEAARKADGNGFAGSYVKGKGFDGDGNKRATDLRDAMKGFVSRLEKVVVT